MTDTNNTDGAALLPVTAKVMDRFWAKVEKRGDDQCWPWTGSKNERGYGSMGHCGRLRKATHISYEIANRSPFPAGMVARHTCDNPSCVNPAHIIPGTLRENAMDMVDRRRHHANRRTECIRGHPLSGDNLIARDGGQRGCRTCQRIRVQRYKLKRKALNHG